MRRLKPFAFFLTLAGVWLLCASDTAPYYYNYVPWFMKRADLKNSVFYSAGGRDMQEPGKIWVLGDKIFVNEKYKGVHIIDNTDPSSPERVGFIVAPGCIDMAVKDDIIYVDNAIDLVAFDMVRNKETGRIPNYFPELRSPEGYSAYPPSDMVVVGWKKVEYKNR